VGHETDTTLIDHAADRRAPTPTAAAEIAVPVKSELVAQVTDVGARLASAGLRGVQRRRDEVAGLARGLPDPLRLVQDKSQRLDDTGERLGLAMRRYLRQRGETVAGYGHRLPHPRQQITLARERLDTRAGQLDQAVQRRAEKAREAELRLDARRRMDQSLTALRRQARETVEALGRILDGYSYKKTLERGFAVVRGETAIVTAADQVRDGERVTLEWADGTKPAVVGSSGGSDGAKDEGSRAGSRRAGRRGTVTADDQGSLF
jgi:exodeoxyribonuclease VII large subunit